MSVITFFGSAYTGKAHLAQRAAEILGYRVLYDRDIISAAAAKYDLKETAIETSIFKDPPFADRYTPAKARCIAAVKSVIAEEIKKGPVIMSGFLGKLIPANLGLHLLVTAPEKFRVKNVVQQDGTQPIATVKNRLKQADDTFLRWSLYLRSAESCRPADCDGIVNVTRTGQSELVEMISEAAANKKEEMSFAEFDLATKVSCLMADKGHPVSVAAKKDRVNLVVHKPVLMFSRYGRKLASLARSIEGVKNVHTRSGRLFYKPDILPGNRFFNTRTGADCNPIKKQYEHLYASVTDQHPTFVNRPAADARVAVSAGQA